MDRGKDLFLISILTFLTVISWMFFELIKTTKASTISTETEQIITPFSPKIDSDILIQLGNRKEY